MKGLFISLEGIEGTGKTTQARLLSEYFRSAGADVLLTEEPGGTPIGLRIREVLLRVEHREMHPLTELLLYNASRVQHLNELILPALEKDKVVITDRFSDSTIAYQGYGRGIDIGLLRSLDKISTGGFRPHLTLLLDLDEETGLRRNRGANKIDRLELEHLDFHKRVREGFLAMAKEEPERVRVIDASGAVDEIQERVRGAAETFLSKIL